MRPVKKCQSDQVVTSDSTGESYTISEYYKPYQKAKFPLEANLGSYCSYCEQFVPFRDLEVEHVQAKTLPQYKNLIYRWDNFLLSCSTCNGSDNKSNKDVIFSECLMPHRDNTFLALKYMEGGVVIVNQDLPQETQQRAQKLLSIVGLDKTPQTSSKSDWRWRYRYEAWNLANQKLESFRAGKITVDAIIELVKTRGFWSIWFTVFEGQDAVLERLIDAFPGTDSECFDRHNHFAPILIRR